jgi:hypothetical protein
MARTKKEYALYKGEECLAIGTIDEIAKQQNVKWETIKFYHTPASKKLDKKGKRRILISLD